jgi:hypothetical protein
MSLLAHVLSCCPADRAGAAGAVELQRYYLQLAEHLHRHLLPEPSLPCLQVELDSIDKRKVWMRAQVTDGGKATYATAKSLFVAPRPLNLIRNMLFGWVPGLGSKPRQQQAVQPLVTA